MSDYKSGSNLEKVLKSGSFAFTGECGPPQGANIDVLKKKAQHLKGCVDAVNVTDNQTAVVRMSSWAASLFLIQEGLEPNYQMVCRDRNRLAMQSDILGAYAHGIRNMLCLSGDHQKFGNHPASKNVFDIDSMQLINMVENMRDEGKFRNDQEIDVPPRIFIGAASNPFADPTEFRVYRLAKKINAGADFIQTQSIYNMDLLRSLSEAIKRQILLNKDYDLAYFLEAAETDMAANNALVHVDMNQFAVSGGSYTPSGVVDILKGVVPFVSTLKTNSFSLTNTMVSALLLW